MTDSISSVVYPVASVASMPEKFIPVSGMRISKFKTADKKQYYSVLPEVSANFVQSFIMNAKGLEAVQDFIEGLQDKAARKVYVNSGRSVTSADLTIDLLADIALAGSENVRITKELLSSLFDADWQNVISYALVLERDAVGAALLLSEIETEEAKQAYWKSEQGLRFVAIARNYKQYIVSASEKKPSFMTQAIKDKVITAIGYLDQESQAVIKMVEKLKNAPIASIDTDAL